MGTIIELKVEGVALDYSKNSIGIGHGFLFQEPDLAHRPSDGVNYDYYHDHPEEAESLPSELALPVQATGPFRGA